MWKLNVVESYCLRCKEILFGLKIRFESETPEVATAEDIATAVGETTEAEEDSATEGVTEEEIPSDDVQAEDETSTKDSEEQE